MPYKLKHYIIKENPHSKQRPHVSVLPPGDETLFVIKKNGACHSGLSQGRYKIYNFCCTL